MIFVSIGTQDKPFLRLIKAIDELKRLCTMGIHVVCLSKCKL